MSLTALLGIKTVFDIAGGISSKNSANKAAAAAARVGEFNAGLIERDIDLLEKQREIINRNAVLQERVDRFRFAEAQGSVVAQYSGAGIDISHGTPMRVMRQAAREFEYNQHINDIIYKVTNIQIDDQQESNRFSAGLSPMDGEAQAAGLEPQGTTSLIPSFVTEARMASSSCIFPT